MVALEGILRKKITLLFLTLDQDENGFLERADFERVANALDALRGPAAVDEEDAPDVKANFIAIFDNIHKMMDLNANEKVELEEWVAYFEKALDDKVEFNKSVAPMADSIYKLLDHDGDGKISLREFRHFAQVYRIEGKTERLFAKLDRDQNGVISTDEFALAIDEFFRSEDEGAPGNGLFGEY
ncbi:MAG: EF-hand domain-containing protein [Chloroflexota bacterium]